MPRILIVTEHAQLISTCSVLADREFNVKTAADFETAFYELLESTFDALIIDLAKGNESIDFIKRVRGTPQLSAIPILVTAEWETGYGTLALSHGADAYEPTPHDAADLLASLKRLLTRERAVAK